MRAASGVEVLTGLGLVVAPSLLAHRTDLEGQERVETRKRN
jgi:hypothetical protein